MSTVFGVPMARAEDPGPPESFQLPAIGGILTNGGTLTAHPGTWSGGANFEYSWLRCDGEHLVMCMTVGTSQPRYLLGDADVRKSFRLSVSTTNLFGMTTAISDLFGWVISSDTIGPPGSDAVLIYGNRSPPVISGFATEGVVLDASAGTWWLGASYQFLFQWVRCYSSTSCAEIAGANSPRYVPTSDDVGFPLAVHVTSFFTPTSVFSASSAHTAPVGSSLLAPRPVLLHEPAVVNSSGALLSWTRYDQDNFVKYEVHRTNDPTEGPTPLTLVGVVTDQNQTTWQDTSAEPELPYTYRIRVSISTGTSTSNGQTIDTPPEGSATRAAQPTAASGKATSIALNTSEPGVACQNSGADDRLTVGASGPITARALLQFDVGAIPSDAEVIDARLKLAVQSTAPEAPTLQVRQLSAAWSEGTGRQACTGDGASWQNAAPSAAWTNPGGDFVDGSWGTLGPANEGFSQQYVSVGMTGFVDTWVTGQAPNHGVLLREADEDGGVGKFAVYWSDDAPSELLRPSLAVTYTVPPSSTEKTIGSDAYQPGPETGKIDAFTASDRNVQCGRRAVGELGPVGPTFGEDDKTCVTRHPTGPNRVTAFTSKDGKNIVFQNDDGRWTIYLSCVRDGPGHPLTVGPGYVARAFDARVGGTPSRLVDGEETPAVPGGLRHISEFGGLGLFGWHHARGEVGETNAFADGNRIRRLERQFRYIEGQHCADPGNDPPDSRAWGVVSSRVLNPGCIGPYDQNGNAVTNPNLYDGVAACKFFKPSGVGFLDIEVLFRDPWEWKNAAGQATPVMRVLYRWRFRSEGFKVWIAVQPRATRIVGWVDPYSNQLAPTPGVPFVKEPKIVVGLRGTLTSDGPDFERISEFDRGGTNYVIGHMRGVDDQANSVSTTHGAATTRSRVRWDFVRTASWAGAWSDEPGDIELRRRPAEHDGDCSKSTDPPTTHACFSVVMRGYSPSAIELGTLNLASEPWTFRHAVSSPDSNIRPAVRGFSLNQWAWDARSRPRAYSKDTSPGTPCHSDDPGSPAVRQWEFGGRKNVSDVPANPRPGRTNPYLLNNWHAYEVSYAMFHGWEGGRGYEDCDPLYREFDNTKSYGIFASFGLNNGFKLRSQPGDNEE